MFQVKCDMYWPEEGEGDYGDLAVRLEREDVLAFYTLRYNFFSTNHLWLWKNLNGFKVSVVVISSEPLYKKRDARYPLNL